jgi:hypothetical protein
MPHACNSSYSQEAEDQENQGLRLEASPGKYLRDLILKKLITKKN